MFQIALLLLKENNCAKLFLTLSVTLTFNLPEQMFQMALLLLE